MAYIKKNNLTKLTKIRQDLGMTRAQLAEKIRRQRPRD